MNKKAVKKSGAKQSNLNKFVGTVTSSESDAEDSEYNLSDED